MGKTFRRDLSPVPKALYAIKKTEVKQLRTTHFRGFLNRAFACRLHLGARIEENFVRQDEKPHRGRNISGLRRGNPGNKGGGRTPEAFKRWCRKMLASDKVTEAVKSVVRNSNHQQWAQAYKTLTSYAYGQPQASVEVKGKLSLEQILARSWAKPKAKGSKRKKGTSR